MSLDSRQHIEAVAIIKALISASLDDPKRWLAARNAAKQWLAENKPSSAEYVEAIRETAQVADEQGEASLPDRRDVGLGGELAS